MRIGSVLEAWLLGAYVGASKATMGSHDESSPKYSELTSFWASAYVALTGFLGFMAVLMLVGVNGPETEGRLRRAILVFSVLSAIVLYGTIRRVYVRAFRRSPSRAIRIGKAWLNRFRFSLAVAGAACVLVGLSTST